jgi:sigma-B regulation protein RsbU (phosphoserine phosphatase)
VEVVAESVEELQVVYPKAVLQHACVGTGISRVSADNVTLLIGNLVFNAVAYGTPSHPVVIESEVGADAILLSNEGPIDEHQLATLFDAMTRGAEGESAFHSLGLGLYIVGRSRERTAAM